ncbi:MAG: hypothetical protein KJ792_07160 [Actinobacteria bacterium]|nr:hypothetical protein [Actinomycetota bacterium]MCG2802152.1 hypothetical protein [Cellulomonas sp.]
MPSSARRTTAGLIVGWVAFCVVAFAIAHWQHWDWLTAGPRPLIIAVAAVPYWGAVGLVDAVREVRSGRPASIQKLEHPEGLGPDVVVGVGGEEFEGAAVVPAVEGDTPAHL